MTAFFPFNFVLKILYARLLGFFYPRVYLISAPDAYWKSTLITLQDAARKILQEDRKAFVIFMRCSRDLPFCVSSVISQTKFRYDSLENKKHLCRKCLRTGKKKPFRHFRVCHLFFQNSNFFQTWVVRHSFTRLRKLCLYGVPIGRICEGDMLRELQLHSLSPSNKVQRDILRAKTASCLVSLFLAFCLFRIFRIQKFVYFQDYSYNLVPALFFQNRKVSLINCSHLGLFQVLSNITVVNTGPRIHNSLQNLAFWKHVQSLPLKDALIRAISYHQLYRMSVKARTVHSPVSAQSPAELESRLGVGGGKTLVFYTSSFDEQLAVKNWAVACRLLPAVSRDPFPDQIELIRCLLKGLAGLRDSWTLLLRVHPREGNVVNQREVLPYHQYLRRLPKSPRLRIILPFEDVSSYALLNLADKVATGWSTMGLEAALLGNCVIRGFVDFNPTPRKAFFNYSRSPGRYRDFLSASVDSHSVQTASLRAFRWFFVQNMSNSFSLGSKTSLLSHLFPDQLRSVLSPRDTAHFHHWHPFLHKRPTPDDFQQENLEFLKSLFLFFDFFYRRKFVANMNFERLFQSRWWDRFAPGTFPDLAFSGLSAKDLRELIKAELRVFSHDPDGFSRKQALRLSLILREGFL